jgi:hypothetical protein
MMGEHNELKNRYMVVNPPEKWTERADRTSTEQPNKLLGQFVPTVLSVVKAIGTEQRSLKDIMERVGLKHRPTFIANYLLPAIKEGLVVMLYPDNPKHPSQKYRLTVKGMAIYNSK